MKRMLSLLVVMASLLIGVAPSAHAAPTARAAQTTVFRDDFKGTSLDLTKWQPNWLGANNASITPPINGSEQNCYDPKNVTVSGGYLHLLAQKRTCVDASGKTHSYASGAVTTRQHFTYTYGTLSARVFVPSANWPSVWADGTGKWPTTGEDDVFERLGTRDCYHFHSTSGGPGGCPDIDIQGGWHTFAATWSPGKVVYKYDGMIVGTITQGITDAPMYVILNQGVSDAISPPATGNVDYLVDWISVKQKGAAETHNSCASPTHMDMTNGSYTTGTTVQYDANHFVQMDAWSPDSTLNQTMDVCGIDSWNATVTETDTSNPRVVTYPDSEYRFTDYVDCSHSPTWSSLDHINSSFAINAPTKGDYDESYDMFLGGTINGDNCGTPFREVMIYTKWHGNVYAPPALANFTTFDGTNYDVYWNADASYIQVRQTTQTTSGSPHIKQVLQHLSNLLQSDGVTPVLETSARLHFIQFGPEVVSGTNTAVAGPIKFKLTNFSVTAA